MTNPEAIKHLYGMLVDGVGNADAIKTAILALEDKTCGNCVFLNSKKRNTLGYMCEHPDRPFHKKESRNACMKQKYERGCSKWIKK